LRLQQRRFPEAEAILGEVVDWYRKRPPDVKTYTALSLWASSLRAQGHYDRAEVAFEEVIAGFSERLGPEDSRTLDARVNLATLLAATHRYDEAETQLRAILDYFRDQGGAPHSTMLEVLNVLGNIMADRGRFDEADAFYREALAGRITIYGPDHPLTVLLQRNLGRLQMDLRRYEDAEDFYDQALETERRLRGPRQLPTIMLECMLGDAHVAQKEFGEAEALYVKALDDIEATLGIGHRLFGFCSNGLAEVYRGTDNDSALHRTFARMIESLRLQAQDPSATGEEWNNLAWTLLTAQPPSARNPEGALVWARRAAEDSPWNPEVLDTLALAQERTGDRDGAIETLHKAIGALHEGHPVRAEMQRRLRRLERRPGGGSGP
jgi:tetratricopeptide (TPR) repeat protein